ncbi:MAG: preprotein translocase subunit SecG [Woeseiaceae bacterium]|jgi:preprotein translocase subunit SecG|tara:strand:+ start:528 stop:932 length:405 start_codon:yes stop_codon:yes gene_type:complete
MSTIQTIVLIAHTVIALLIIILVLLQRGKGADAGAAFGSGASSTVFGSQGSSNFFSRSTAVLAAAFFVSSLSLAYLSSQQADAPDSLIENIANIDVEENSAAIDIIAPEMTDGNSSMEVMPSIDTSDLSPESEQ